MNPAPEENLQLKDTSKSQVTQESGGGTKGKEITKAYKIEILRKQGQ